MRRLVLAGAAAAVVGGGTYLGLVTAALPLDLGVGRRTRPLGPLSVRIAAPRQTVYDVLRAPYAARPSRALKEKVQVLERGTDMVLAAHRTPLNDRLTATTVETVRFTRPERINFRLVRGPVPYVAETFTLTEDDQGTLLAYTGELGTDVWSVGAWWGNQVAGTWQTTVEQALNTAKVEAERIAGSGS